MGLFGGKKDKDKEKKKLKKAMPEAVPYYKKRLIAYKEEKKLPTITSREYRTFMEKEKRPLNWYEKLCQTSSKVMKLTPPADAKKQLEQAIAFAELKITPEGVMGMFINSAMLFVLLGIVLIIGLGIPVMGGVMIMAIGALAGYYLFKYPVNLIKELRIKASSQVVLAVLYMVVSMRMSPNLERAFRFAAVNVTGALAWDMRRLLWDIQMRKYAGAWEAMDAYITKWKPENEEFSEAMRLIRDSTTQVPERSAKILDEALDIVLEGTKTRMKHYAQELKMPVMVIHMMGIIMPVLGTIMAPLAAVFMADIARPEYFVLGYNIAIPAMITWFIITTLRKRPVTFSAIGLEKHPDIPRKGHFFMGKKQVPVLPISLLILAVFLIPSIMFFVSNPDILVGGMAQELGIVPLVMSSMVILGIGFSMASYFYLANFQKLRVSNAITKTESEFELALFQLGNRIAGGMPTEVAIESSIDDLKDLEIAGLFKRTLNNIRSLGFTFEQALFDEQYGSLLFYPSKLIRNVMTTIVDTAKRGVLFASESMLRISKYLKNIRETQEYMQDLLEETSSSMKFQAYMLTPLILGLIVSMADVITLVLSQLGTYLEGMGTGDALGVGNFAMSFGFGESSLSPSIFQLIIGFYLLEIIIILAMFLTKVSHGDNKAQQWYTASKMLVVGLIFYIMIAVASSTMFGGLIRGALSNLGI
ncbi:MAG: hypothetical protein V3V26_01290 [Candidatus Aenigmarchaeota archaeon]